MRYWVQLATEQFPPSALVDADGAVLHLSPSAGRFILLSAGPLSGRLTSIVQPELRRRS